MPFDDNLSEQQTVPVTATSLRPDVDDTSILVPVRQNRSIQTSSFEKALAIFADLTGLSRQDWASLREILFLVRDKDDDVPGMIQSLPRQLSTLRDRMRGRMPMMHMREADIPLNILKLPTLPATLKPEERRRVESIRSRAEAKTAAVSTAKAATKAARENGRDSAEARAATKAAETARARVEKLQGKAKDVGDDELSLGDLPKVTMRLTFFDPPTLFRNLVASDIGRRAHTGPGFFVDAPHELFESHSWLSSVRTTSGRYAHIILDDGRIGPAIFPSDWVYYRCLDSACELRCSAIRDHSDDIVNIHIGRVYGVGLDRRTRPCTAMPDELCLQIQEAHRIQSSFLANVDLSPAQLTNELVLCTDPVYIPESLVYSHIDVHVDRHFGEEHHDPGWKLPKQRANSKRPPEPYPKYIAPVYQHTRRDEEWYLARRMVVGGEDVVPLCHTHPIRAELELDWWGRAVFEGEWDQAREGNLPVVSFPHIDFIDGFGVFSNSYRTLMGFYFTPAGLSQRERARPGNIFPIVLG